MCSYVQSIEVYYTSNVERKLYNETSSSGSSLSDKSTLALIIKKLDMILCCYIEPSDALYSVQLY
jgi:hypothetical protein